MSYKDLAARLWNNNVLYTALLELTYRCNLDCFFCYNDLSLGGRALGLNDYRKLLDDLAEMGTLNLILSGGEPLAYPHFFALGAHAREHGFAIRVKSNGHSLGQRLAQRLKQEVDPFLVEVSIHGACADSHDRQTRVAGSFERLMNNIRTMQDIGLRVKANATLTAWNEHESAAMYELADNGGFSLTVFPEVQPRDDGDTEPLDIRPSRQGLAELFKVQAARAAAVEQAEQQSVPLRIAGGKPAVTSRKHCGAGSSSVAIDPYGNVYPCVQYRRSVGSLHEDSIRTIWTGSGELTAIREESVAVKAMVERENLGSYCPGAAHLNTGDPLKPHDGARIIKTIADQALKSS